jgi:hypothetical protein
MLWTSEVVSGEISGSSGTLHLATMFQAREDAYAPERSKAKMVLSQQVTRCDVMIFPTFSPHIPSMMGTPNHASRKA